MANENPGPERKPFMTKAEESVRVFESGFNCSQAVFAAFGGDLGLERDLALRLACGLGAGMARTGQTCGAVSGAYLALSLKHGRSRLEDEAARDKTYALMQEFTRRFRERHGSVQCTALMGCDLSTPQGYQQALDERLFRTRCPVLVRTAVEITEALF
jgi:C_GCAxxG_C_C family probable redox protein